MILEPLELNISPELFDEHFLDFIADFSGVTFNKIELSKFRHRYIIYRANIDEAVKFGEIERIPVQDGKLEVKVAIVDFDGSSHNFFYLFYEFIADKWGYVPWMYHDDLGDRQSLIPILVNSSLFSLYRDHNIPISDYGFKRVDEYRLELSNPSGDPKEDYRRKSLLDDIDRGLPPKESCHQDVMLEGKRRGVEKLLPKKDETKAKWKKAYRIIQDRQEGYLEDIKDSRRSKKKTPTIQDLVVAIANDMDWPIGEKTVRNIIKVGEAGLLD